MGYPKTEAYIFTLPAAISAKTDEYYNLAKIRIFPNPVTKVLIVQLEYSEEIELILTDINGRERLRGKSCSLETSFDLSLLEKGTYILRIEGDMHFWIKKIVKD